LPKRAPVCWPPPREGETLARATLRFCLVGKPSTISSCSMSGLVSFLAKWSSSLGDFNPLGSLANSPQQNEDSGSPVCAAQLKSAVLRARRSSCKTRLARFIHNLFSCNDFLSGVCYKTLTMRSSERKISPPRVGSKRPALSKSPHAHAAGLSPENVE